MWWPSTPQAEARGTGSTTTRKTAAARKRIEDERIAAKLANRVETDVTAATRGSHDPPILIVEILSPGNTYSDTQQRAHDYARIGVLAIWIIDPQTRTARVCKVDTWTQATRLEVPGMLIYAHLHLLFEALDCLRG